MFFLPAPNSQHSGHKDPDSDKIFPVLVPDCLSPGEVTEDCAQGAERACEGYVTDGIFTGPSDSFICWPAFTILHLISSFYTKFVLGGQNVSHRTPRGTDVLSLNPCPVTGYPDM